MRIGTVRLAKKAEFRGSLGLLKGTDTWVAGGIVLRGGRVEKVACLRDRDYLLVYQQENDNLPGAQDTFQLEHCFH